MPTTSPEARSLFPSLLASSVAETACNKINENLVNE